MNPVGTVRSAETRSVLTLRGLVKTFDLGKVVAVDDVSLEAEPGEILSILGPSGCGKTTILRIIAGLEECDSGELLINGRHALGLPPHKRNVGLVFQDLALFPHKTVAENVEFGLRMHGVAARERKERVDEMLGVVELPPEEFADRLPAMLSGGQRQRVALARTLVVKPELVLFDEPMSSLDRRLRDRMAVELRQIQKRLGVASIYVTHDQETASMMSDRIAIMEEGRIVQIGTPLDVYQCPGSRFVADFIGDANFIDARVVAHREGGCVVEAHGQRFDVSGDIRPAGTSTTLAIRPHAFSWSETRTENSIVLGGVTDRNFVNGTFIYTVRLSGGQELSVQTHDGSLGAHGAQIWLAARPEDITMLRD